MGSRATIIGVVLVVAIGGALGVIYWLWSADDPQPQDAVLLRDEFLGATTLDWHVVRPNDAKVSLDTHLDELTILTEGGSIWKTQPVAARAKNLYLVDNPVTPDGDWQITTCLVDFQTVVLFQQAGLLIYQDDDNYVKLVCQHNTQMGQTVSLAYEDKGDATPGRFQIEPNPPKLWLRIVVRRQTYQASFSYDGEEFIPAGAVTWRGQPKQVGLIAKNGGNPAAEPAEARFDFFELTQLAPETAAAGQSSAGQPTPGQPTTK